MYMYAPANVVSLICMLHALGSAQQQVHYDCTDNGRRSVVHILVRAVPTTSPVHMPPPAPVPTVPASSLPAPPTSVSPPATSGTTSPASGSAPGQ
ncbi:hypothetical protein C8R47DRAFT_1104161 [Mycena vitilis]|nr:hypothetical protein C8R47DRAFT_1104161 [Mycena vitilis]